MTREVLPERLDALPPDDPLALGSRRDLARINSLMGNARLIARLLEPEGPSPSTPLPSEGEGRRILEIGAGDGAFMLRVARRLGAGHAVLLDRQDAPSPATVAGFERLGWTVEAVREDVFDLLSRVDLQPFDAIVANLFLHHFEDDRLRWLLCLVAENTGLFVACEPERSAAGLLGCRLMPLIGCNEVTLHDARVSVRAGFRGREMSALWPSGGWELTERAARPFSHLFRAERRP